MTKMKTNDPRTYTNFLFLLQFRLNAFLICEKVYNGERIWIHNRSVLM